MLLHMLNYGFDNKLTYLVQMVALSQKAISYRQPIQFKPEDNMF